MPSGPRIVIKDDRDSSLNRGCVLYGAHFRPEIARIPWAVARTAATYAPEWTEVTLSEGWRPKIRAGRDLHSEARAFDVSLNHIQADEAGRYSHGIHWARAIREELGPDYQVVVHGEGQNLHIHIELDP
jgi:hypothetical protein